MGTPVGEAIVRIYVQENGEWIPYLTLVTDEYGHAETYLPRGFYMIVIEKEGYKPVRKYVKLVKDTKLIVNLPVTVQLPPQRVAVSLMPPYSIKHSLLSKIKMITPQRIIASFITSVANIVKIAWEYTPIRSLTQRLLYAIINRSRITLPQATSVVSFAVSAIVRCLRNIFRTATQTIFYSIRTNVLPRPSTYIQLQLLSLGLIAYRNYFYPLRFILGFTIVSKPSLPSPLIANSFSLSVGVRKTP